MDDLISRQVAIDAIRRLQTYKLSEGDDMLLVDKAEVQTELMMLPSAQRWIPCEDRCPEKSGNYLVTDDCKNLYVNEWHSLLHKWQYDDSRIVAWMPLPEPWKGGGA